MTSWFRNIGRGFGTVYVDSNSAHYLNHEVFSVCATDNCSCYCSDQGCTPFLVMLKAMVDVSRLNIPQRVASIFSKYVSLYHTDLQMTQYKDAVRYLTFVSLGMQHTCRHHGIMSWDTDPSVTVASTDDIENIQDEQHYMCELLNGLISGFLPEIMEILARAESDATEMIRFWEERWAKRMKEEIDKLDGSDLSNDQKSAAEDLGVIWHDSTSQQKAKLEFGDPGFFEAYFEQLANVGSPEREF